MKITKASIYPLTSDGKVRAMAQVEFDECFVVTGFSILDGAKGLFVSMPRRKTQDGEYKDIAFPVTKGFREELVKAILDEYVGGDDIPF